MTYQSGNNLSKRYNYGISDYFPNEVDEMRKKLYPVLKKAGRKESLRNVERLILKGALYRGAETRHFPLYGGHLLDSYVNFT